MPRHTRFSLLLVAVVFVWATLVPSFAQSRIPGNNLGYSPEQPIRYSHRLHAGELQIPCQYCHRAADQGRHAGIPSADVCMNCHGVVRTSWGADLAERTVAEAENRDPEILVSAELQKLYDALGLDAHSKEMKRDVSKDPTPIHWKQVHRLPDFTFFNHSVHVNSGVTCQTCHGPIETMERVRQFSTLRMGWCLDCHRGGTKGPDGRPVIATTDCSACHY